MSPKSKTKKIFGKEISFLAILTFIICLVVYYLTSAGKTPYDYFTRLAASFLNGKYYLTENQPWLSELIPEEGEKYHFVNPPMPALLSIPFVFLFKQNFEQQFLAHIIGALIVVTVMEISSKFRKNSKFQIFVGLFIGFSSIIWFLSSVGSVWYLGQISACLFIFLAIYESLNQKRPFVVGLFLSFSFLSRLQTLPSLFFFLYLIRDRLNKKGFARFCLGILVFVLTYSFYNFLRFGKFWETGYTLIPNILNEPWFDKGQFSFSYIPKHLKILLLGFPTFIKKFPYFLPSWKGLAIWITSPVFIFSFFPSIKNTHIKITWLSILAISLINFCYGSTGYTQFGYRYAVDFYPFLTMLAIQELSKFKKLRWYHWLMLFIGIGVNLWGVVFINKFSWVSF